MSKLFIFQPSSNWDYCGGMLLILADSLEQAKYFYHEDLRQKWIDSEIHLLKSITHEGKARMQNELNTIVSGNLQTFLDSHKEVGIDSVNGNCIGHYWELTDTVPVSDDRKLFSDGNRFIINYNYA